MHEQLYADNKAMLYHVANRYRWACEMDRAVSVDDLAQAGFFGLVRAEETYKPEQGKTWASWACRHIENEIVKVLGRHNRYNGKAHTSALSLDCPIDQSETDGATLGDMLPDDRTILDAGIMQSELRQAVREAIERIPDTRQRQAVKMRLHGYNTETAARIASVSVKDMRNAYTYGTRKMAADKALRAYLEIDLQTRFYANKGVNAFIPREAPLLKMLYCGARNSGNALRA